MRRPFGWTLAVLLVCGVTTAYAAPSSSSPSQPAQQPPAGGQKPTQGGDRRPDARSGRFSWWEDAGLRAEVGLSDRQAGKIKNIFEVEMVKLRAMRDDLEKQRAALEQTMKDPNVTLAAVTEHVDRVGEIHAAMYRTRELMLYRIYRVLSPEQRTRLDGVVARLEKARRQEPDRRR